MDRFETFTGTILELSRYLQKLKELEMKPFGLRANHVMALYYLGKHPDGLTVTELTEACREDKAAVSRCVAQLIERSLISGNFPENKRSYRTKLHLTESGQELVRKLNERVEAIMTGGRNGLSKEQSENLYAAMEIILNNLSRYVAEREN